MIYVMRHGESVVNLERRLKCKERDGNLSTLGREQAFKAARWLSDKGIMTIYTSPFDRAMQTAEIIATAVNVIPQIDDDLHEMDCGNLEGRVDEDAWDIWSSVYQRWIQADWAAAFPNGETFRSAYDRLLNVLMRCPEEGNTVLVTHGGITRTVVPYLCVNAAALQRVNHLDNTGMIVLEPYDAGRFVCESWNIKDHLTVEMS